MEFKVDIQGKQEIRRNLDILGKKKNTVVARAINKTTKSMRYGGIKAIKERYTVKASALREVMKIQKANRNKLFAVIKTLGTRLKLRTSFETFRFALAKGKKRVMVQILKQGSPKILRHAFYGTFPVGGKEIAQRKSKERIPTRELSGLSVPQMVKAKEIKKVWERIYNEKMLPTLSHEIEAELKGYVKGYGE